MFRCGSVQASPLGRMRAYDDRYGAFAGPARSEPEALPLYRGGRVKTSWRSRWRARREERPLEPRETPVPVLAQEAGTPRVEIPPGDPIVAYFQKSPDPVDIDKLQL